MEFLRSLENSGFGVWVRESGSLWSYPTIIFLHSLGLTFLVGVNAAIDLRLLGFAPRLPLPPLERLFPIMWLGFWINAVSGVALTITDAATMLISPIFYTKMAFIVLAVVNMVLIRKHLLRTAPPEVYTVSAKARVLAATSLVFWAGAITAGRLTAYLGPAVGLNVLGR